MLFDTQTYQHIKTACENRQPIDFDVDRQATAFANGEAPARWTAYPPALLPPQGYAHVFLHAGDDLRAALIRLELVLHLDGGQILYKENGPETVSLQVTWPAPKQL